MNEIQNIETKVENGGTTPQGRVSAAEFNIITDAAKRFDVSKYGAARISEGGQLQFFADAPSMASYEADPQTNAALLLKSLSLPTSNIDISGKLDKEEFYRFFEEVNIGTADEPVYATRSKRGLFSDSFLSALGLNPSTGGGGGGGATALSQLTDVILSQPTSGDLLSYNGSKWVNIKQSSITPDLTEYATQAWVKQQGYATTFALNGKVDKTTKVVAGTGLTGGGALTGDVTLSLASRRLWGQAYDGSANVSGNMTGVGSISASGEIKTTSANAFRSVYGGYGAIFRNDGEGFFLLLTDKNNAEDSFNSLRPLYVQFETGTIRIGGTSALTVQDEGNIGIGTSTPAFKLDVVGEVRVQKRIYFGDSAHYIELDSDGHFHFSHGVYSDEYLSVKGSNPDEGGGGGGATALSQLTDVSLSALAEGQLLMYNGTTWENVAQSTIVPTLKSLTFGSKTYNGSTAQTITAADLGALTAHQTLYSLTFQAGAFSAKTYTPNVGTQTINIPTKTSHLSNDSGFITASALSPYITAGTANATFATKLGASGNQIGTYVNGTLENLITVPYTTKSNNTNQLEAFTNEDFTGGGHFVKAIRDNSGWTTRLWMCYKDGSSQSNSVWVHGADIATQLETTRTLWGQAFNGTGNVSGNMAGVGSISASGEITTSSINAIRFTSGNYGTIFRQEGGYLYLLLTDENDQNGLFNAFRPFTIVQSTGRVNIGATLNVLNAGNVGIGTSAPAYTLDVIGTIHATTGIFTEGYVQVNNRIYFKGTDHYIEIDSNGLFHFSHGVYTDGTLAARGFNNSGSTISLWGNTYDGKNSIDGVIRSIYAADPTDGTIIGKFLAKKSDPLGLILRTYTNGSVSLQSQRENDNLKRFVLALNPLGGNVAINQTSASYTLDVAGTIKASVDIIATGTVTAKDFIKPSDARLKTYMEDIELSVQDVANAPAWRYKWKSDGSMDVGSTTQYWGRLIPELIHKLPDGKYYGLDYGKTALLSVISVARTVQSHEERIAELERENEQLKQTLKKYIS